MPGTAGQGDSRRLRQFLRRGLRTGVLGGGQRERGEEGKGEQEAFCRFVHEPLDARAAILFNRKQPPGATLAIPLVRVHRAGMPRLLEHTPAGLHCAVGGFTIDPSRAVERAVITHAHSDHARSGAKHVLTSASGARLVRARVGERPVIQELAFGEQINLNGVLVSLHPAGHILGSAQVRLEYGGEVWVVTGDYKRGADPTCEAFEPVRCDVLVTECTFGLPVYRWPAMDGVRREIADWWRANREAGRASVIFGYSLGKAQRVLSLLDPDDGPIIVHGAVERFVNLYRASGIALPPTIRGNAEPLREHRARGLFIAPPGADGPRWLRKLAPCSTAFASGWMAVRGTRRQRGYDRGFVVSDHIDWPELIQTVRDSGAREVWAMHGSTGPFVRWLNENGWTARELHDPAHARKAEAPPDDEDDAGEAESKDMIPAAMEAAAAPKLEVAASTATLPDEVDPGFARFTALIGELHLAPSPDDQVAALTRYFRTAEVSDAAWAAHLFADAPNRRHIPSTVLRQWVREASGYPDWLVRECLDHVGDAAETFALLLPVPAVASSGSLAALMQNDVLALKALDEPARRARVAEAWLRLPAPGRVLYNKLLAGTFRPGVSRALLARALAGIGGLSPAEMAHRLTGGIEPDPSRFQALIGDPVDAGAPGRPYPFLLALPLERDLEKLGDPAGWVVEWKWDGIRAQVLRRGRSCLIWTRGEEAVGDQFPALAAQADALSARHGARRRDPARAGSRARAFHRLRSAGAGWGGCARGAAGGASASARAAGRASPGSRFPRRSRSAPGATWSRSAPARGCRGPRGSWSNPAAPRTARAVCPGAGGSGRTRPSAPMPCWSTPSRARGRGISAVTLGVWSEGRIVPVCKIESGLAGRGPGAPRPVCPRQHGREVRPRPRGEAGAGVRDRLRRRPPLHPPQVRPHPAQSPRVLRWRRDKTRRRGRHPRFDSRPPGLNPQPVAHGRPALASGWVEGSDVRTLLRMAG
jgi:putative mRNA 3-end processing factor